MSPWILDAYATVLLLGCCVVWALVARRRRSGLEVIPYHPRRNVPWDGFHVLSVVVVWFMAQFVAGRVLIEVFGGLPRDADAKPTIEMVISTLAGSIAAGVATFVLSILLLRHFAGATWTDLGLRRGHVWSDVRLGVLAFIAVAPPVYAIQYVLIKWFPSQHRLVKTVQEHGQPDVMALVCVSAVIMAPLVEELLFRVVLQGWLQRFECLLRSRQTPPVAESAEASSPSADAGSGGDDNPYRSSPVGRLGFGAASWPQPQPSWMPITVSAAVFASLHWEAGPDPVPLFVFALALGYLYRQTNSILPGIVVHLLLNGTSMLMLWTGMQQQV